MADLTQLTYNRMCRQWLKEKPKAVLTEVKLAEEFEVSRTTIREVLKQFEKKGLIRGKGRGRQFVRQVRTSDVENLDERVLSKVDWVQEQLMKKMAKGDFVAHKMISELELSKQFEVTTGTVREALLKLTPLQLFSKQNRQRWKVVDLNEQMINEVIEFRQVLELQVLKTCCQLEEGHELWLELKENLEKQKKEGQYKKIRAHRWIGLDREFHQILARHSGNVYISEALKSIGLIMYLQQEAIKIDQEQVQLSIRDHMNLYKALKQKKAEMVENLFLKHLKLAKNRLRTLIK